MTHCDREHGTGGTAGRRPRPGDASRSTPPSAAGSPAGPRGGWLLGTSGAWRVEPHEYARRLVEQYGPAVRYHYALGRHGYLLVHPDHYREVLQHNHRNFDKAHPIYDQLRLIGGQGMLTAEGATWRRHRQLAQPSFHPSTLSTLGDAIVARTRRMIVAWRARAGRRGRCELDIDTEFTSLTLAIVGDVLLGADVDPVADRVHRAFTTFTTDLMSAATHPLAVLARQLPILPPLRRMGAAARELRAVAAWVVARRRRTLRPDEPPDDLLGVLLRAQDAVTGAPLTHDEVCDEVATLLIAGHETSATALTWTVHLLASHPEIELRVLAEVDTAIGERAPETGDLPRLPMLRAVIAEALRLYPPIWAIGRRARAAAAVGDIDVPAGAFLMLNPYVTHRLRELWHAPDEFVPDRFLPGAPPIPPFAYLPFSAGPRGCIGERLATTEMALVLATLLQAYRLRRTTPSPPTVVPTLTLRAAHPVRMVAERR